LSAAEARMLSNRTAMAIRAVRMEVDGDFSIHSQVNRAPAGTI
jgi:hypothetical protein